MSSTSLLFLHLRWFFPKRTNNVQKVAKKKSSTIIADDFEFLELAENKRFKPYLVISSDDR
jgi:hypothetical protein